MEGKEREGGQEEGFLRDELMKVLLLHSTPFASQLAPKHFCFSFFIFL